MTDLPDTKRTRLAELLRSSPAAFRVRRGRVSTIASRPRPGARPTPSPFRAVRDSLSYRALDLLSNRMARRLRDAGAGPESLVGLCAERSLELIVGLLGILKAGGAYVPLDPSSPADRLQFQLDDSGARILLAQHHLVSRLPKFAGQVVSLDPVHEVVPEPEPTSLDAGVQRRESRLRHLYFGLDGNAQGRGRHARQRHPPVHGHGALVPLQSAMMCSHSFIPLPLISRSGRSGLRCSMAGAW